MRRISISIILLALLGAGACTRELAQNSQEQGEVVLRIALDGLDTKSDGTVEENTIKSLQLIIFSGDGNTQYYSQTISDPSLTGGYYEQSTTVSALTGLNGTAQEKTNALKVAKVFAVANYPGGAISNTATLADVKDLALSADNTSDTPATGKFVYEKDGRYHLISAPSFAMTAEGGFVNDGGSAVASLQLKRLAAKVSLTVNYAATPIITDGHDATLGVDTKTVWTPLTDEDLRVYLDNAVMEATLGGPKASPAYFTYADNHPTGDPLASAAFYTYPSIWTEGSGDAPFVKIIQPWHYQTVYKNASQDPVVIDENVVELYYKVMFPGLTALESNTWYRPAVTLNVLGGEAERPTVLVPTGLDILPWGNASAGISQIDVQPVKYLTVERENTTVSNGNKVQVRYFASGPATLTVQQIFKQTYQNAGMVTKYIYPADGSVTDELVGGPVFAAGAATPSLWFSNTYNASTQEGIIQLNHELSTTFGAANFAARPYTYSLSLSLDGGGVPDQAFTITQIPSVLVEGQLSTGWVSVNDQTSNFGTIYRARKNSTDNAITAVISNTPTGRNAYLINSKSTSLGYVNTYVYLDDVDVNATNASRYRMIVKPAPNNKTYVLDPRIDISTNNDDDGSLYEIVNTYKDGSNNVQEGTPLTTVADDIAKIKKYKPAINPDASAKTSDKDDYLPEIAPEFMISSSYGKGSGTEYYRAVLRCAAYQEDGYPAGRWRLPTEAEILYCVELSKNGAMPSVFGGLAYWASSGRRFQTNETWSTQGYFGTGYTRCVYDTWYWGQEEVEALKDGTYSEATVTYQKYKWSGWDYITKK